MHSEDIYNEDFEKLSDTSPRVDALKCQNKTIDKSNTLKNTSKNSLNVGVTYINPINLSNNRWKSQKASTTQSLPSEEDPINNDIIEEENEYANPMPSKPKFRQSNSIDASYSNSRKSISTINQLEYPNIACNLDNFDCENTRCKITSPRSLDIIRKEGIDPNDLYLLTKEQIKGIAL